VHPSFSTAQLAVFYSPQFLEHNPGRFHPENAGRLTAIVEALQQVSWADQLEWCSPTPVAHRDPRPLLGQIHHPAYLEALQQLAAGGGGPIDEDTVVSARSFEVALLAVNAWIDGVDYVLKTDHSALVLSRPPGHHALRDRGMGFCLLANAVAAAHHALQQPHIQRVAILDWDVHHGNGTEALVWDHPHIAYASLHQHPCYPGTGQRDSQGAHGNVLNVPLPPGSDGAVYRASFEAEVLPFLQRFAPDLLIVSAGYDAAQADPLANMALQPADYGVFTTYCLRVTPRILFGLEGGYDHSAISQAVVATLGARLAF